MTASTLQALVYTYDPGRERRRDGRQRRPNPDLQHDARLRDGTLPLRLSLPADPGDGARAPGAAAADGDVRGADGPGAAPERSAGGDQLHGEIRVRPGGEHLIDHAPDRGQLDASLQLPGQQQPARQHVGAERSAGNVQRSVHVHGQRRDEAHDAPAGDRVGLRRPDAARVQGGRRRRVLHVRRQRPAGAQGVSPDDDDHQRAHLRRAAGRHTGPAPAARSRPPRRRRSRRCT